MLVHRWVSSALLDDAGQLAHVGRADGAWSFENVRRGHAAGEARKRIPRPGLLGWERIGRHGVHYVFAELSQTSRKEKGLPDSGSFVVEFPSGRRPAAGGGMPIA